MKSERSTRKIATILIAVIFAISAFSTPMAATVDDPANSIANVTDNTTMTTETLLENVLSVYNESSDVEEITNDTLI
jgi:hypothetical protein